MAENIVPRINEAFRRTEDDQGRAWNYPERTGEEEKELNAKYEAALPLGPGDWEKFVEIPAEIERDFQTQAEAIRNTANDSEEAKELVFQLYLDARKYFTSRRMFFAYFGLKDINPARDTAEKETQEAYEISLVERFLPQFGKENLESAEVLPLDIFSVEGGVRLRLQTSALPPLSEIGFGEASFPEIDLSWALCRRLVEHGKEQKLLQIILTLAEWEKANNKKVKADGTFFIDGDV